MINANDLQSRKFATSMDGQELLTNRSHTIQDGTTQHIHLGFAHPGSDPLEPVWLVKRITILADGSTATLFAGGEAQFNQVWDDHATLNYA
ncbi:MAG: hypothetical protein HQL91_08310 [Magnetococcales bacterium]|nr:hypothetical protein [Magnetococcales bacterium]